MSYIKFKNLFSNKGKGKEIGRAISGPILQYPNCPMLNFLGYCKAFNFSNRDGEPSRQPDKEESNARTNGFPKIRTYNPQKFTESIATSE
jgi:hypothetical protein